MYLHHYSFLRTTPAYVCFPLVFLELAGYFDTPFNFWYSTICLWLFFIITDVPHTSPHHHPISNAHCHHNNNKNIITNYKLQKTASHPHPVNPRHLGGYKCNPNDTPHLRWLYFKHQKHLSKRSNFKLWRKKNRELRQYKKKSWYRSFRG